MDFVCELKIRSQEAYQAHKENLPQREDTASFEEHILCIYCEDFRKKWPKPFFYKQK